MPADSSCPGLGLAPGPTLTPCPAPASSVLACLPRLKLRGVRGSALALVPDEVLHLIGKVQPLLVGLNLPDEVESCR